MLNDKKEIKIISKAKPKTIRGSNRSREPFYNIFSDFLSDLEFDGAVCLDLGPGHFDFGEILKTKNGVCWGMDKDPAVVELGKHKGFNIVSGNLKKINDSLFPHKFDGLFCKLSINAFWYCKNMNALEDHVDRICSLLAQDGWGWVAPWNGISKKYDLNKEKINSILEVQIAAFEKNGFTHKNLTKKEADKYGVAGVVANNVLFTKGL